MKKKLINGSIIILVLLSICLMYIFIGKYQKKVKVKDDNKKENFTKYELQTHEYFASLPSTDSYIIDSKAELHKFYAIYSEALNVKEDDLKDNTYFIKVASVSSGSIKMKLSDVNLDNNKVNFIIDKETPEIGTDDMAFWYFVAIIPNSKLKNLDLSEWHKPSEVADDYLDKNTFKLDTHNKYEIITDLRFKTLQNDGGSNTSIYYQIDLDNKYVIKVQEDYHANLLGTPTTDIKIIYKKNIENDMALEIKSLINNVLTKEDTNEEKNYSYFTILSINTKRDIYNINTIEDINKLLQKIDQV